MPINRNKLGRLLVIHEKLSTQRKFTWEQLAQACQYHDLVRELPSRRTIIDDIQDLRETFCAPIPYRKPQYYYETPFSLFEALNPKDASLIQEAVALFGQLSTLPQFAGLEDIFLKFEQRAGVVGAKKKPVVLFEQNLNYTGLHWLTPLYNAILHKQVLRIKYTNFHKEEFTFQIHPYLLRQFRQRWYVYGWSIQDSKLYNLALDRIQQVTILNETAFIESDITDWGKYFEPLIGVTMPENASAAKVLIRVSKPRAYYLITKPLHSSQVIVTETENYTDFGYTLILNKELTAEILALGPDAAVLEPEALRSEIKALVKGWLTQMV
jgi:predicted DNA-binding transcriptional regulator YafY